MQLLIKFIIAFSPLLLSDQEPPTPLHKLVSYLFDDHLPFEPLLVHLGQDPSSLKKDPPAAPVGEEEADEVGEPL